MRVEQKSRTANETRYSVFGIAVDRRKTLKWLFPQEKATFHNPEKVYVYSENAIAVEAQEVVPIQAGAGSG